MNYCLRCNKPCSNSGLSGSEPSVFCDECRSLLRDRLQFGDKAEAPKDLDLLYTSLWQEEDHETGIRPLQSAGNQQPTPSTEGTTASAQTYGTFAHWRSREGFAVKPISEASLEAALSAPTHLTTLQSPDANVQDPHPARSQVSLTPESEQDSPLHQTGAWRELEQKGRDSNIWTNQVDPLMARLDTNKFPTASSEKQGIRSGAGEVTTSSSSTAPDHPTAQRRVAPRYLRTALVVLAILVVLALAVSGAIAFKSIPQQHNAQTPVRSPMLTATGSTAQLPSPTVQSTPSPAPGVGQPPATSSSAPEALTPTPPTPATSGSGSPTPGAATLRPPVENVSSSALTFNTTQGQANPSGQAVKIANTGGSSLYWTASVESSATSWLSTATSKGTVAAGQTGQVIVNVNIAAVTPGSYRANVTITATNSSGIQVQGSPQVVPVTLTVAQPCTLQVSPSSLSFTVTVLQSTSPGTITLIETGNCAFPISWTASADQGWIILSATSGKANGSGSTITVHANGSGMFPGQYQGRITISAVASGGASVQGSPQTVSVTMNVSLL